MSFRNWALEPAPAWQGWRADTTYYVNGVKQDAIPRRVFEPGEVFTDGSCLGPA